jgi:hypothetical protein
MYDRLAELTRPGMDPRGMPAGDELGNVVAIGGLTLCQFNDSRR